MSDDLTGTAATTPTRYVIRRGPIIGRPSRVDTRSIGRLDSRPARKSRAQIKQRGGASNDDEDAPPVPMRCAYRRPGNREICAHLELDRWRQDR